MCVNDGCMTVTEPSHLGHPTLCLPCSERDIGEKLPDLRARIGMKMTRNQYQKYLERQEDEYNKYRAFRSPF